MKNVNFAKLYGNIGKILCGAAGAIVGLVCSGAPFAVAGLFLGLVFGHFFEKAVLNPALQK